MGKHPAGSFQIVVVVEEVAQEEELFVGALAGDLSQHVAGVTARLVSSSICARSRSPEIHSSPPERQLLLHHVALFPDRRPGAGARWRHVAQTSRLFCIPKVHGAQATGRIFKVRVGPDMEWAVHTTILEFALTAERSIYPGCASTASTSPGRQRMEIAIGRQQTAQSSIVE